MYRDLNLSYYKESKICSFCHVYTPFNFHYFSAWMLKYTGLRLGLIGLFCLTFLFLPVARGSILLRLLDIPFEQATRYHVWLGHLTMLLFSLHGIFYVIGWAIDDHLIHKVSLHAILSPILIHIHLLCFSIAP